VRVAYSALFRAADAVAGVSHEVVDDCRELFRVPPLRLHYIPNGRSSAAAVVSDLAARRQPRVGFVGHLTETKRPSLFVDTVAALRRAGFDGEAWMAGDGPLLDELRPAAAAVRVELLGRRDDVPRLLGETDVLLFTSVPAGEGMPGVLIEAGFAGVPVVATDVPGARSVVRDEETGYVVAHADASQVLAAARRLIEDRALRMRMGEAARAHCLTEFSLQASAQRWRELLAAVTGTAATTW
jgi:glycosyltransferase involved in cell wall biosynthesis